MVQELQNNHIVVLGSKPNAILPDIPVNLVYGVNGAVELAVRYREKYGSTVIGFVRVVELRKFKHIQDSIKLAKPDELLVAGDDDSIEEFIKNDLGLQTIKIKRISTRKRLNNMEQVLGWRKWLVIFERVKIRGIKHFFKIALPDIILNNNKDWLSHSTGFDTIMYLIRNYPDSVIVTAGISAKASGHFNNKGQFTDKTAKADQGTLRHWPHFNRKQVYTTDIDLKTSWGFPLWGGPNIK